jgi:hypothetical protein
VHPRNELLVTRHRGGRDGAGGKAARDGPEGRVLCHGRDSLRAWGFESRSEEGAGAPARRLATGSKAVAPLTLEYLEAAFYAEAKASKALKAETLRFATVVSQHEAQHVAFLKKVLGASAVATPKFDFAAAGGDRFGGRRRPLASPVCGSASSPAAATSPA